MYIIFYIIYTHIFINSSNHIQIKNKNKKPPNWRSSNTFTTFPSGIVLIQVFVKIEEWQLKRLPPPQETSYTKNTVSLQIFIQKPIFKKNLIMNLFGQTTTLSSRHTVKMAWLRIDQIFHDLLTASYRVHVLLLLHHHLHDRDLWI